MNNLYKRFVQQHVKKPNQSELPEGDLCWNEYGEKRNWDDEGYRKTRSRSRGRRKGSSSSSRSSSSSSDDSSPKKKKKKKEKKHKKKKKSSAKKKKRDHSSSESEPEVKKEEGPDWRVELLKRMKEIKSLPPEQLETEFKKAMAEKKRREEEEKCIQEIEKRQKLARKVKKESEKAARKAAKEAERESKIKEEENEGDGFYGGFHNLAQHMGDPNLPQWIPADAQDQINPFKSGTFAEVPFVPEEGANIEQENDENAQQPEMESNENAPEMITEESMDPYARALSEQMKKEPKDDQGGDVSWPAGAIENTVDDGFEGENKEQVMEECDEYEEDVNIDDNTKSVMNTSKMFSKVRNRIKKRPLNIHLKTNKLEGGEEEGVGLQPLVEGEATPGEGLSGEEMSKDGSHFAAYYENVNYGGDNAGDEYDLTSHTTALVEGKGRDPGHLLDEEEERRVARYRERARKRRERAKESGELEDGEHSPSPEPERPHHRRRRKRRHEREGRERRREGTPVMDEGAGGLEEGEIGDQDPREDSLDDYRDEPPSKITTSFRGPPPTGTPGMPFVDTSVPPPNLNGPPLAPPPFLRGQQESFSDRNQGFGVTHGDRNGSLPPSERSGPPGLYHDKRDNVFGPPPVPAQFDHQASRPRSSRFEPSSFSERNISSSNPLYPPAQSQNSNYPPSSNFNSGFNHPPPGQAPRPQPSSPHFSEGPSFPRPPSPQGRYDAYSGSKYSAPAPPPPVPILAPGASGPFFDSLPRIKSPDLDSQLEPVDSDDDEDSIDITKVSPIMKYIAGKLSDQKYHLELSGPFKYNSNIPGLSKPLFVAFKMVTMLESAGYNGSKMYMSAMFPAGIKDTKAALIELVTTGKLDSKIKGNKLVKMCVRCIRCFLAYYTGKNDDIDSSEGECSEGSEDEDEKGRSSKTVKTSMMDILGRIKDEKEPDEKESTDPLSSAINEAPASIATKRYSVEDNPWSNMELGMRSNNLKTFTALQSHFTKQLVRRGVEPREAREQASESMMCFVVANFTDTMLRHMVTTWKGEILPDQSQLEVTRSGKDMTLYDQIVAKLLKHQSEFPLSIIQEVKSEPDWKGALLKKMRNIVERMLKFYLKGLGKLGAGEKGDSGVQIISDPQELRFNYLPEGLRETEETRPSSQAGTTGGRPEKPVNNFFNMEQAAQANRSFSSYTRTSLDEQLSPVSPESGAVQGQGGSMHNMGIPLAMGGTQQPHGGNIQRQKYLFGTFYVDTLLYQGSSYVYELGVYMSDSSSCEVYIVPTKLFKQNSVLEMLGFSFNPDEKKYIYMKPGTAGFCKTYSEEHGLDRIMQFLREKRYDSRGDSENLGLVLASQSVEDLATWVKFTTFHRKDWELKDIVAGYSCLDMFIEESKGMYSYIGPKLHRERDTNQTYFTWEYVRGSFHNEAMSAGKADALYSLVERLLDNRPNFENFFKNHVFTLGSRQYGEVERRFNIIKDMYNLEYHLATSLNVRSEKRRLVTEGIFSPRTTAELGDKPGLVAARMIRILAEFGYSKHSLNSQILEARERGRQFTLPTSRIVEKVRSQEVRQRCEQQVFIVTKYIEDYFLRR